MAGICTYFASFVRRKRSSVPAILAVLFTITQASDFDYPLHPYEENRAEPRFHPVKDVREQILERYNAVERRWKTEQPIISPDTSSPPISSSSERGPFAERRDFSLNLQPGAPPFWGPNGEIRQGVSFPANGNFGGNFCDEGALDERCVLHQTLSFPGDYTISGRGTTPFRRAAECECVESGCSCEVLVDDFVPSFGRLSWATLTLEVERGSVEHEISLVQGTQVNGLLVQGQCNPPPSCHPDSAPLGSCMPRCGDYHTCFRGVDVTQLAQDGQLRVQVQAGHVQLEGGGCDGGLLRGRLTVEGEYVADGTLDLRRGGGLVCTVANCTLRLEHFRAVYAAEGSVVAAERVEARVPLLVLGGRLEATRLLVRAASLVVNASGALLFKDPRRLSRADLHVRPGALPGSAPYTLPGCNATCSPCTCLQIGGLVWFSRVVVTGLSLRVESGGHLSADRLGHPPAQGQGAGESTRQGGGGGGFGGRGTAACAGGGGAGGGGYGLAAAPSDLGYCVSGRLGGAGEAHATGAQTNETEADAEAERWCGREDGGELGSGGGHGAVEGGRGAGAIRIHTEVEVVVVGGGRVSADGEASACVGEEQEVWAAARGAPMGELSREEELRAGGRRETVTVARAGGGGGSGGSIWVSTRRLEGRGVISASGGGANRSCDTVREVTSGGAGGGGRVALDYDASSMELRVEARGGTSRCTAGGAGSVYDAKRRLLLVDNGGARVQWADAGSAGVLEGWPGLAAAVTPWSNASAEVAERRRRTCWTGWAEEGAGVGGGFACELGGGGAWEDGGGNASWLVWKVVAREGAILEFPTEAVGEVVVTDGGGVMATGRSRLLAVEGDVTVEREGVLGCYSCGGSVEVTGGQVGCERECPGWRVEANGSVLVKEAGRVLGVEMEVLAAVEASVEERGSVLASDWMANSTVWWEGGAVRVDGRVHVTTARVRGARVHIGARGWVGTDGLGWHEGEGAGAGNSSGEGGGGGGHGGEGADSCYAFARGGEGYGSALEPLEAGSGGGRGGATRVAAREVNESRWPLEGRRGPVVSEAEEGLEVRQVRRRGGAVRTMWESCRLRGSRRELVDAEGERDEATPESAHGSSCAAGYRGSSMRNWCCRGEGCDCALLSQGAQAGGRGGGVVELRAEGLLVIDGEISARGEGVACRAEGGRADKLWAPAQEPQATGGAGGGGSVLVQAAEVVGTGIVSAEGGSVGGGCGVTKSGGGGGGGRVAVRSEKLVGPALRVFAGGGRSDGCVFGGAGTVYWEVNRSLVVEGLRSSWAAAMTRYPRETAGVVQVVVAKGAASLEFPTAAVEEAWAVESGALVASAESSALRSRLVALSSGGALGCFPCRVSVDAQNRLPGCGPWVRNAEVELGEVECPAVGVETERMSVTREAEVRGVDVELKVTEVLEVEEGGAIVTSDEVATSNLRVQAGGSGGRGYVRHGGLFQFSSVEVAAEEVWVRPTGWLSADALGWQAEQGPGAGSSHWLGGGGGGHGGHGAQGCGLGGPGGGWYDQANATSPWSFGSGGGSGGGNGRVLGGRGGGRIRLEVQGNVTVDGVVSADGAGTACWGALSRAGRAGATSREREASHSGGGGAGGAVWVQAGGGIYGRGAVLARGGEGGAGCHEAWPGGGGGGGRIALESESGVVRVGSNASGGRSGYGEERGDEGLTARKAGCSAGGAGTVMVRRRETVSLFIDNGLEGRRSAPTGYPQTGREVAGLVVSRGAILQFPSEEDTPDVLKRAVVRATGAVVAWPDGRRWEAEQLLVGHGGIVGCVQCGESVEIGNGVGGCHGTCTGLQLQFSGMEVETAGRVMALNLSLTVSGQLWIAEGGGLQSSDWGADSRVVAAVGELRVDGFVRFSDVEVQSATGVLVERSGRVSASGMGFRGDEGPGAGGASHFGGGGGGHAGDGDGACKKSETGEVMGLAGQRYALGQREGEGRVWYGSGGGHGNASIPELELGTGGFSYPRGGHVPCFMDPGCEEGMEQGGAHGSELLPVFEVARETGGGRVVRATGRLCWPRGHRVEAWRTDTVMEGAAVPRHPRACAPGWHSSMSMPDYCCQGLELGQAQGAGGAWGGGGWWCDCSPYESGPNPGGRGGGRVRVAGMEGVRVEGEVSADGEATAYWVPWSNPGGGGAGGTVEVEAATVVGGGRVSAVGGGSTATSSMTLAGGGGGGGSVHLRHQLLATSIALEVEGGRSNCPDNRIGRTCERLYTGQCTYKTLGDEFNGVDLVNPAWEWGNEPPPQCTQAAIENTLDDKELITQSNPHQGRCWDVSMSRLGWLRIRPSQHLQMWDHITAHRLFIELDGREPFDVETVMTLANNDSSCVTAGLFASGEVLPAPHNATERADGVEFVSIALLDYGSDAKLQWSTRGTPMEEVLGLRSRQRVTALFLRLVKDGDGTLRGYWKLEVDRPWNPTAPAVHWTMERVRVGLFAANCGEFGNSSVDFDYLRDNANRSWARSVHPAGASGFLQEQRLEDGPDVTVRAPPTTGSSSSSTNSSSSSSSSASSVNGTNAGNSSAFVGSAVPANATTPNATNTTLLANSTGGSRRLLSNVTAPLPNSTNATGFGNITGVGNVTAGGNSTVGNASLAGNMSDTSNSTGANATTAAMGNSSSGSETGAEDSTGAVEVGGLQDGLDAASGGGVRRGGVSSIRMEEGQYQIQGLDPRGHSYVVLRGNLSGQAFTDAWHNTSAAHFVTSDRFVETPGAFSDDRWWNGSAWVSKSTVFHVSIRPNAAGTQYVFFIDGVENPSIDLSRPAVRANPHSYIFILDPETFNATLPPLNTSDPSIDDGSGGPGRHGFVIKTRDEAGLENAFYPGTRYNGVAEGQVEFRVGALVPNSLFYASTETEGMGGQFVVSDTILSHAALQRSRRRLLAQRSPREAFRGRLSVFYRRFNREKLGHLDDMTEAWMEKEEQLNAMLLAKYGESLPPGAEDGEEGPSDAAAAGPEGWRQRGEEESEEARKEASLRGDRRPALPHEGLGGVLPGGSSGVGAAATVNIEGEEQTIVPPAPVVIDCGGGSFFGGNGSAELLLVDIHVDILNCVFTAASSPGARAITIQHSIVRLMECEVVGGAGGLDVDSSLVDVRTTRIAGVRAGTAEGGGLRIGLAEWRVGGKRRAGSSAATLHRRAAQVYLGGVRVEGCSAASGGAVAAGRGTWYCQDCTLEGNSAGEAGGAVRVREHGAGVVSNSRVRRNLATRGGGVHLQGGSFTLAHSEVSGNGARSRGGGLSVEPKEVRNPTGGDEEAGHHSLRLAALCHLLDSTVANNSAVGSTSEPAFGGGVYLHGGGVVAMERCVLEGNAVEGDDAEGGGVGLRDGGVVYMRDSAVLGCRAGYGAAVRVRTERAGVASVLLDNVTVAGNVAGRFGAVVALHAHNRVLRAPFLFRAGRYFYNLDPDSFRSRPLLRFGFNGNPYLDPYPAGLAPQGTDIQSFNPYEDAHHVLELPPDPRLTDQWPFWSTGERHAPYLDPRTTTGQKAASGGVAFLLGSAGSGHLATLRTDEYDGVVAFKDCNIYDNEADLQAACYWHNALMQHSCLPQTRLL